MAATTRVYRFGVRWDVPSIALLRGHIETCDRMYNELAGEVNTLLKVRERYIAEQCPEYARLQDELAFVDRTRNPHFTAGQRKAIVTRLRAELKGHVVPTAIYRQADLLVKEGWPATRARINAAYSETLCWTHRGAIDRAVEAAGKGRKTSRAKQARTWGYRIRERESDGTGTIGGQTYVQTGIPARDIFDCTRGGRSILRINGGEPLSLPHSKADRRRAARVPIAVRLETGVYLHGIVSMHRELPTEGMIKEVRLSRRLEGGRQSHHILFTVTGLDAPELGQDVAGLDVGWAGEDGALTAGALALPDREVLIRPPALPKLDWVDELKGATDREQDALRDQLAAALAARGDVPEHLQYLARWRSSARLEALTDDDALTRDEQTQVRKWTYHRRHRLDAMAGARGDALATRDQYYHGLVREMVDAGVGTLAIERGVLETFSRREKDVEGTKSQRQRARVALSSLIGFAKSAGIEVVEVHAAYTSRVCSHCGECGEGARDGRAYNCAACGVVTHADENAARNIRALGIEHLRVGETPGLARKPKKLSRAERMRAAREAKKEEEEKEAAE